MNSLQKNNSQKAPPTTTADNALRNNAAEHPATTTTAPQINSVEPDNSSFSVSDRAKLAWKPSAATLSLRSGDTSVTQAHVAASSPAIAILAGDYDGAIKALSRGGLATAACGLKAEDWNLTSAHAVTLLAKRPTPPEFIRAFLAKLAELQPGAIDKPDGLRQTALTYAAQRNDLELIKLLLAAGADPAACDHDAPTAMQIAVKNRNAPLLALLHSHLAASEVSHAEHKLITSLYKDKSMEGLRMLTSISANYARAVMKHIVDRLPVQFEKLSSKYGDGAPSEIRPLLERFLPLLDTAHQYQLLHKLIELNADAARLMLEVSAPRLSVDQLRIVRHAAAAKANAVVHEWAARTAPDMPGKGAATAELNTELLLSLQARNRERAVTLIDCGASFEGIVSPDPDVSLLALLADCDPKLLEQHLKTAGKEVKLGDMLQTHSRDGLLRLVNRCELKQVLSVDTLDGPNALAVKAVQLDCADLLKKTFALHPELQRPWAGLQSFPTMMQMMNTPLKEAIKQRDLAMVEFLLDLGTVPSSVELEMARDVNSSIAETIDAAYQNIPEERRA